MYQFYSAFLEMTAAAVFLIPAFWLYGRLGILKRKTVLPYLVFSCYLAAVFALVGMPNVTYIRFDLNINLIPLADLIADFRNACLNVLLFVPLGIFLPVFWERYRSRKRTALAGLRLSCLIETLQIFTFRATDVNDLITNTLGAVVGFALARCATRQFVNYTFRDQQGRTRWIVLVTVLAVMFFCQPFVSAMLWALVR